MVELSYGLKFTVSVNAPSFISTILEGVLVCMGIIKNLEGQRFGKLLVICKSHKKRNNWHWKCICDCGNISTPVTFTLTNGDSKSCGCVAKEKVRKLNLTHGETDKHPEYNSWCKMKSRCLNPKDKAYNNYGGRGITICKEWINSYENFLSDMGRKPSKLHSLDRYPNNDGNYEPSNCRWATKKQQADNRRSNVLLEYNGIILRQNEWAVKLEVPYYKIASRLKRGKKFPEIYNELKKLNKSTG